MTAPMTKEPQKTSVMSLDDLIGDAMITTSPMDTTHRCDRCGAQALVRAELGNMKLIFCAHHARANIPVMAEQGWKFDDQSARLLNA